jgi:hypothetical protein
MLGLGDIALPGLLVSFLLRFDYNKGHSWKQSYFVLAVAGYAVGMLVTDLAMLAMQSGQVRAAAPPPPPSASAARLVGWLVGWFVLIH